VPAEELADERAAVTAIWNATMASTSDETATAPPV
jgi:hypothetical protein